MNWKLPNQLTVGRIALAAVFFLLVGLYDQGTATGRWLLNAAFVVYILAGVTDVLDGYLARKWNLTSAFGRIVDPFVDKLLVVGAFAMLTGSNYVLRPDAHEAVMGAPAWLTGKMFSAVQAWMVVVIMAREFVVSAVRGYSESCGVKFPATPVGKVKMLIQSVAICTVLYQMANVPRADWAVWVKVTVVWLATVVTVFSGFVYVGRARKLLIADE
jgi:phosphatidylglycerophosphate synthase